MRVVTTASKEGYEQYGHRWLESIWKWPEGTEFCWYTEGYSLPDPVIYTLPNLRTKDFSQVRGFTEWKLRHAFYLPPSWRWDVVRYAHKVFAACDALEKYDGVGVWLDADCVTFENIPAGLIEQQVADGVYIAHYARTGHYTETGMWIMNCAHPEHGRFLTSWRNIYMSGRFRQLPEWHDCMTLDATIRRFAKDDKIKTRNLSGEHSREMHPQALSELGKYIDHCKGPRKGKGYSAENKDHAAHREGRGVAHSDAGEAAVVAAAAAAGGH